MKKNSILFLLCSICATFLFAGETSITPAHVYQLVKNTHKELELIREHENVDKYDPAEFAIENANPREVFYQAIGLLEKTNNLCFSYTREVLKVPSLKNENLTPKDVFAAVNLSYKQLLGLKKHLGITEQIVEEPFSELKTPTDVFRAIIQIGRQISVFDGNNINPADVYQRVSATFIFANELYFNFRGVRMIEEPELVEGKVPADVYGALLDVITIERDICNKLSTPFAEISESTRPSIKPSDVSDLAGVALSEIRYLVTQLKGVELITQNPIYTEGITPSQVFQRVQHLQLYLEAILQLMDEQPNVLTTKENE